MKINMNNQWEELCPTKNTPYHCCYIPNTDKFVIVNDKLITIVNIKSGICNYIKTDIQVRFVKYLTYHQCVKLKLYNSGNYIKGGVIVIDQNLYFQKIYLFNINMTDPILLYFNKYTIYHTSVFMVDSKLYFITEDVITCLDILTKDMDYVSVPNMGIYKVDEHGILLFNSYNTISCLDCYNLTTKWTYTLTHPSDLLAYQNDKCYIRVNDVIHYIDNKGKLASTDIIAYKGYNSIQVYDNYIFCMLYCHDDYIPKIMKYNM